MWRGGANRELQEDYRDYLLSHGLQEWRGVSLRFDALFSFCKEKSTLEDYQRYFEIWTDDEMANCAICLSHLVDRALEKFIKKRDEEFITQGGIRERMTAARLGYRAITRDSLLALQRENQTLKTEVARLQAELAAKQRS